MLKTLKSILQEQAEKGEQDNFNYPVLYSLVMIALDKGEFARDRLAAIKILMPYLDKLNVVPEEVAEGEQLEMDFEAMDKVMIKRAMQGDTSAYNALVRKASTIEEPDDEDYDTVIQLVVTPKDMSHPRDEEKEES